MIIGKIQKNVKIPTVHSKLNYPWEEMEVDDSIFIGADNGESLLILRGR